MFSSDQYIQCQLILPATVVALMLAIRFLSLLSTVYLPLQQLLLGFRKMKLNANGMIMIDNIVLSQRISYTSLMLVMIPFYVV